MGEMISSEKRVARKPHFCAYCNAEIAKGETHLAWTWAEDSRLSSNHAHERCAEMADFVFMFDDGRFDPAGWIDFREECAFLFPYDADTFPWTATAPPSATPPAQ